jgi:hypothetical protein
VKIWKKIYQDKYPQKEAGGETLTLDKVDFKLPLMKQDKEGHSILIKGEIHQKEITIMNLYAPNTVVVGVFNTPLSPTDRLSKQNINRKF